MWATLNTPPILILLYLALHTMNLDADVIIDNSHSYPKSCFLNSMTTYQIVAQVHTGHVYTCFITGENLFAVFYHHSVNTETHKHTLCPLSSWCRVGTIKIHFAVLDTSPLHCLYWSSWVIVLIRYTPSTATVFAVESRKRLEDSMSQLPLVAMNKMHYLYCLF